MADDPYHRFQRAARDVERDARRVQWVAVALAVVCVVAIVAKLMHV